MRQLVAFLYLAGEELKAAPFWIFLIAVALIGPAFVMTDSSTARDVWENRPLLSEPAAVEHFNTGASATGFLGGDRDAAVLLFRTPETEIPSGNDVSPIFAPGWRTQPLRLTSYSSQALAAPSSLLDFHRRILPILMILIGILALPSHSKRSVRHRLAPCGQLGNYLMIAGVLGARVALVAAVSCVFTGVSLAITDGLSTATATFTVSYFAAVAVYGLAFAFLGLAIRSVIRNLNMALMAGLACGIGVLPLVFAAQTSIYRAFFWTSSATASAAMQNPIIIIGNSLLNSPGAVLEKLTATQQRAVLGIAGNTVGSSVLDWSALALFLTFWIVIAWIAFSRFPKDAL